MSPIVRPETTADHAAIREVNRLAFGREDEARLVDALRDGGYVRASLVAEEDGQVVGHILFSDLPIVTPGGMVPALSLAPMAVIPSHQRRGIGSMLVREGLRACRVGGTSDRGRPGPPRVLPPVRLLGEAGRAAEVAVYSGPAFMAVELVPGALEGVEGEVRYPPPFGAA